MTARVGRRNYDPEHRFDVNWPSLAIFRGVGCGHWTLFWDVERATRNGLRQSPFAHRFFYGLQHQWLEVEKLRPDRLAGPVFGLFGSDA